jgi:hypothetical protein
MALDVVGNAHQALAGSSKQQRTHGCLDEAIGDVEDSFMLRRFDQPGMEARFDIGVVAPEQVN